MARWGRWRRWWAGCWGRAGAGWLDGHILQTRLIHSPAWADETIPEIELTGFLGLILEVFGAMVLSWGCKARCRLGFHTRRRLQNLKLGV